MKPGETVILDRSLKVTFVKDLPGNDAIVSYAGATHVVPKLALSHQES